MADEEEVIRANNNDEVFIYMEGEEVPRDVVRVQVHPSVAIIPQIAFQSRRKLEEIELCEGLTEIGNAAFHSCESLKHVNIPSTVKTIGSFTFCWAPLQTLYLPDSIESIGDYAFSHGLFPTVRIPSRITTIATRMFSNCSRMFSAELPETITQIVGEQNQNIGGVFNNCRSLRNVAVPPHVVVGVDTFKRCTDLLQLFDSESQIINALKHRFDDLPIHKMIYYHSYNNLTSEQLEKVMDMRSGQRRTLRSKLDPTGNRQDCLGMTPLHILACCTEHHLELYRVLIEKYPENLVAKDRWGTVPLLYAVWGNASSEVVQLLVEKYQSIYPTYEFDWTKMITTLGERSAPESTIQSLLDLQKVSFPAQMIDWGKVLNTLANVPVKPYGGDDGGEDALKSILQLLVKVSISTRIDAIGIKQWRDDMAEMMAELIPRKKSRQAWLNDVKSKLSHYEAEYLRLKETTTTLELALWKTTLNESSLNCLGGKGGTQHSKKRKIEDFDFRKQCRVNCGADIVIEHVLTYLLEEVPVNNTEL